MTALAPGFPLGGEKGPDAVEFEVVISSVLRVGNEQFAAAVLPDASVVLESPGPEVPALHIEENAEAFPAPSQREPAGRLFRPFRPVETVK